VFGRTWRIARVGGVDINVASSWVFLGLLIVFNWWSAFDAAGLASSTSIALAVLAAFIFFASILAHEGAHAIVARLRGITVLGITLHLFGGFTAHRGERSALDSFLISAAGPLTSFVVGFGLILASRVSGLSRPMAVELDRLGGLNVFLAIVNSLPGYPMDGGQVLRSIVWGVTGDRERATAIAAGLGQVAGVVAIAFGAWQLLRQGVDQSFYGFWFILVGTFIFSGARQAMAQSRSRRALAGGTAEQAMSPLGPPMSEDMSLSESLDRYFRDHRSGVVPVVDPTGNLVGLLTFDLARKVGADDPLRPIGDAMARPEEVSTVQADEALDRVVDRISSGRPTVVLRDGTAVGSIGVGELNEWLRARLSR
jgi:Zn-dependent protease/CBS domain-containing protein